MDWTLFGATLYLACGGAVFLIGVLILHENAGSRLHRISAAMLFFGGFGPVLLGLGRLLSLGGASSIAAPDLIVAFSYIWELFFPSLLLFALVFPKERAVLRRVRGLWWMLYIPYLFHVAFVLLLGGTGAAIADFDVRAPMGSTGGIGSLVNLIAGLFGVAVRQLARVHIRFFSFVDLVTIFLAIALLAGSARRTRAPKIRRQLRAILFGLGSCVGIYAVAVPLPTLFRVDTPEALRGILLTASLVLGTGSIAWAVVRTSFLDLGAVIRRAILFSGTSGVMVLVFFLTARQIDDSLIRQTGRDVPIFQTLFLVLAVVFFQPIMGRIEQSVDHIVSGDRAAHRVVLRRLGRELTAILDLDRLAETVGRSIRDALALESVRLLLRQRGGGYTVAGGDGNGGGALADDHPLMDRISRLHEPSRAADLLGEIGDEDARSEAEEAVRRLGARLIVPIQLPDDGGCIGFLALGPKVTGGRFNAEDAMLLSILSTQVGIAVRNAAMHEEAVARRIVDEELALARSIQESIVPRRSLAVPGVDVAALNLPSRQVGGDYYDLIPIDGGGLGIAVGDVSGKGVPAALLMSMLHAALHVQINGSFETGRLMERLNRILFQSTSTEQFATFFFGVYEPAGGAFRYTNGGHNYPVLLKEDGRIVSLREGGLVLGFSDGIRYDQARVVLEPGDLAVFYSDGVTEQEGEGEEQFGEERLFETVRRHRREKAGRIVQEVVDGVARFAGTDRFADDFTLIVLRASGEGGA
ncbi:MAG: SpoIIE family protein phosphatase [Candidatus Eisenbacteria bacterium]|nr:SpoIIE family protein phosphatase [Candidatus Eisenbacteria bacterium]